MHVRQQGEGAVHRDAHHEDVGHRAEARALAQRDPQEEDQGAHDDRHDADRQPGPLGEALMQDAPGLQTQARLHEERRTHPVQGQPRVQLEKAAGEVPGRRRAGHDVLPW